LPQMKTEIRDGMRIEWDVAIRMDDGIVLRADVFRPVGDGRYPAIVTYGPYAKGLDFKEGYPGNWARLIKAAPEVLEGSTGRYMNWEVVDPEKWVPDGYACVRVDSRGAGRSPGYLCHNNARENRDFHHCIEWAATQPWSSGKVGLCGISYYASSQWRAAATQPPHLTAICVWEGWVDNYRDSTRHGGIACDFRKNWQTRQVKTVQHGVGKRGPKSAITGELVCGPGTLSDEQLLENRENMWSEILAHPLDGPYYRERSADLSKVTVPLLSAGNWGGQGLHPRGNFEGYIGAASKQKWLEVHGSTHFTHFYDNYGLSLQKKFFGHFLRNEKTGWNTQPTVTLNIRRPGERFELRAENEWPLARTQWTKYYLEPADRTLGTQPQRATATIRYEASGDGVTFLSAPTTREMEITGPVAAKLWLSSDTSDADVFLVLRVFDPAGKEVVFQGSNDPRTPIGLGWLRASHRKLDPKKSLPYRPWHAHDERWPLAPGNPVELDIEIWPTCIVVPSGYRIGLTVRGKDYEYDGTDAGVVKAAYPMKGVGPFTHTDPRDRPPEIFGGTNTLHFGGDAMPYLLLPIIPPK